MGALTFTAKEAEGLAKTYATPDMIAQRNATLERLGLKPGESVIDVGSGPGFLSEAMAAQVGPEGRVLGIDVSPDFIALSRSRNPPSQLSYAQEDALALSAANASFDCAVSTQVAEYIADTTALLTEMHRVLRPGGRVLVMATDWDCVAWFTGDMARMEEMMRTWESHCAHPRLPRELGAALARVGFTDLVISAHPIINTSFTPETYSYGAAKLIRSYAEKSGVTPERTAAWLGEMSTLHAAGKYYFAASRMIFEARKPE